MKWGKVGIKIELTNSVKWAIVGLLQSLLTELWPFDIRWEHQREAQVLPM